MPMTELGLWNGQQVPVVTPKEFDELRKKVEKLATEVKALETADDDQAVKFENLNFQKFDDARTFIEAQEQGDYFGLVVDVYTLCVFIAN